MSIYYKGTLIAGAATALADGNQNCLDFAGDAIAGNLITRDCRLFAPEEPASARAGLKFYGCDHPVPAEAWLPAANGYVYIDIPAGTVIEEPGGLFSPKPIPFAYGRSVPENN